MNNLIKKDNSKHLKIKDLQKEALYYAKKSVAENTKRAYTADWSAFISFCKEYDVNSLPASYENIAHFLVREARTLKHSTLQRRLGVIRTYHRLKGHYLDPHHPVLETVWRGIKRVKGTKTESKEAIWTSDLKKFIDVLEYHSIGNIRDRAVLLFGFLSAQRRENIAEVRVEDLTFSPQGIIWKMPKSKTDQSGEGKLIPIPHMRTPKYCAVTQLDNWLRVSGIKEGYVFRRIFKNNAVNEKDQPICGATVNGIVKRTAKIAGYNPEKYGGHSLRIGFISQTRNTNAPDHTIMKVTGHRDTRMIDHYAQEGNIFQNLATHKLRL